MANATIKSNLTKTTLKADISSGSTVKVNVTSANVKTTTTQNIIKAIVKDQGPIGPQGIQGPPGPTIGYVPVNKAGDTMEGKLAPSVESLIDASLITTDASLGTVFQVVLTADRTISAPTNSTEGQLIEYQLIQDSTGNHTVTWASGIGGFNFGSFSPPTLSTTPSVIDRVGFRYNTLRGQWLYNGAILGF